MRDEQDATRFGDEYRHSLWRTHTHENARSRDRNRSRISASVLERVRDSDSDSDIRNPSLHSRGRYYATLELLGADRLSGFEGNLAGCTRALPPAEDAYDAEQQESDDYADADGNRLQVISYLADDA